LLDADADRADLELRLIKLTPKDRARVHPVAGNGISWRRKADFRLLAANIMLDHPIAGSAVTKRESGVIEWDLCTTTTELQRTNA
jgi:hypothetical protein